MSKLLKAYDRSRVPLYIQVASVLRGRIQSGRWAPGQKISNLEELEREFEVARVTVRQAVDLLREERLLHAQQGRGTFVSATPPDRHWLRLGTTWDSLIGMVKDNVPHAITVEEDAEPPVLNGADGAPAEAYVLLRSVQYRADEPYSIVDLHLARPVYERDPRRFLAGAALPVIASLPDIRVRDAHQTLVIGSADLETANALAIPLGAPTVECHCVVVDHAGTAIYVADIVYRSDCIKLQIDLMARPAAGARRRALPGRPEGRR